MSSLHSNNEAFRAEFRQTIPESYSGVRHALIVLLFGVVAITICIAFMTTPVSWIELAMIPSVVLAWNLVEWYGHKLLHRPGSNSLSRALYTRHTLTHHRFFTHQNGVLDNSRDLKIVFFPVFALPAITVLAMAPAALM